MVATSRWLWNNKFDAISPEAATRRLTLYVMYIEYCIVIETNYLRSLETIVRLHNTR